MTLPSLQTLESLRILAVSAAAEAAEHLLHQRPASLVVDTKSSPTDVVTQMDRESEQMLIDRVVSTRPDDAVLGEEGASRAGTSGYRWVIDPLDGTVNYLYGLPSWAVSIGVEHEGETVVGVVNAPALGIQWIAVKGQGAFRIDRHGEHRLALSSEPQVLGSALIGTGFAYDAERRQTQAAIVARLLPKVRDIRRLGAAAVDLCLVADGSLDGFYEQGLQPWDKSAGELVVTEAGGSCEERAGTVFAGRHAVFGQLVAEVEAASGEAQPN